MRRSLALVVAVLVLGACGGGGGTSSSSGKDATLAIRDEAARVKAADAAFVKAVDGQDLHVGETVRTNGTGFVQIDFPDGSLARLDADAELTLRSLSADSGAQRVVGNLDGGRMWSQVERITSSDGGYEIDTDVANATVRGTEFDVDCRSTEGSCTFSVAEGKVAVRPRHDRTVVLDAGQHLTVLGDGTVLDADRGTLAELRADPWISRNLALDKGDEPPATSLPAAAGGWRGTVEYEYRSGSSGPGGGGSEHKRATFVLDGVLRPDGLQDADATASTEEHFDVTSGGDCGTGWSMDRTAAFTGHVSPSGAVSVRDLGDGRSVISLSFSIPAFPATETGQGCWTASPDPKQTIAANLPEVPFASSPDPTRLHGSWTDPASGPTSNRGESGEYRVTISWDLRRAGS